MRFLLYFGVVTMAFVVGVGIAIGLFRSGESTPEAQVVVPLTPQVPESDKWSASEAAVEATRFREYTLYWLGDQFDGLPLTRVDRFVSGPGSLVPEDSTTFIYGTCAAPPESEGGCAEPLQIIIKPYCYEQPDSFADQIRESPLVKVRGGADAQRIGGGLRIWTGDVALKIYAESPEAEMAVANALVSPNQMGPPSSGDPLPAAGADCSNFVQEPHPRSE